MTAALALRGALELFAGPGQGRAPAREARPVEVAHRRAHVGRRIGRERRQRRADVEGMRDTPAWVLLEEREHQPVERRRDPLAEARRRRRRQREVLATQGTRLIAHEGRPPGDELVEDHAERVEIAACVERLAEQLLGRHVPGRAMHEALDLRELARDPAVRGVERGAEVDQDRLAIGAHEDVLRLEVAVQDALLVNRREGARDARHVAEHRLEEAVGRRRPPTWVRCLRAGRRPGLDGPALPPVEWWRDALPVRVVVRAPLSVRKSSAGSTPLQSARPICASSTLSTKSIAYQRLPSLMP